MRARSFFMLATALFGVFLAGCLESDEQFTINPDGHGKVAIEATIASMASLLSQDSDAKKDRGEEVREFVKDMLANSEGIDAWKDITCKAVGDDKILFRGTAYFSDLNALNIHGISSGSAFVREVAADGSWVIRLKEAAEDEEEEQAEQVGDLSEEEIATRIDSLRADYEMGRAMMGPILEGIRQRYVFMLPGSATASASFGRTAKGGYETVISGSRILAALDSMAGSDDFWRQQVISGKNSSADRQKEAAMMIFGTAGPPTVKVSGGKPLFDYDAEVKAARKKYAAMLKPFGLKPGDIES